MGWLRKFGAAAADYENAQLALESCAALLVYPGDDYGVFRPSWKRLREEPFESSAGKSASTLIGMLTTRGTVWWARSSLRVKQVED